MNAWAPPPAAATAAPAEAGGERPKKAERGSRPQPTTQIQQGAAHRYRLRYTKLGRAAYLGHLDLVRHLPRVFRRAGLELCYSVGFHPKPELTFGPALGLGIPSLGEMLDVSLVDDLSADELLARLGAVSLPGVDFLQAVWLGDNDRALGRVIASAEFAARLPNDADLDVGAALARWASDEPLTARRESDKGLPRTVDVRASVLAVTALEDAAVRRRLDWSEGAIVRFSVRVSQEGSARPVEVLSTLFGEDVAAAAEIARLALWARVEEEGTVDPLALAWLRHRTSTHAPPARAADVVAAPAP